jgi:5'-deoxynucleotidase YfbR-like HD superfamily hydrolase
MRYGDFIQTYSGIEFYPLDPRIEEVKLLDIAHALSNICRFTGHCNEFYSVAQHSVLVSQYVSKENAMWGLLHDASEAYICDIARPVKKSLEMKPYKEIEKRLMNVIAKTFNLSEDEPKEVKEIDTKMLRTEARDLGLITERWSHYSIVPFDFKIIPLQPKEAEKLFLTRFNDLMEKNNKNW